MTAINETLKNIVLSIRVPGNHTRTVGDLVNIDLPSSHFPGEKHRYYAGNYLITELSHKIGGDSYYMDMKLVKDNLSEKLQDPPSENLADFVTSEQSRLAQVGNYNDNVGQDLNTTGPNFQRAYRGGGL